MSQVNARGLSRYIPADVKRDIRRRSKNGCVICRNLVCDYEHIEPTFAEAAEHGPEQICLLCTIHHREVTSGRLSKAQVLTAYANVQNNTSIQPPLYRPELTGPITVGLGDAVFEHMPADAILVEYDSQPLLRVGYVDDPIFGGSRPSINGEINDSSGALLMAVRDNEIEVSAPDVDAELSGSTLTIRRRSDSTVALQITFSPPNGITFDRVRMRFKELLCEMDQAFGVTVPVHRGGVATFLVTGVKANGAQAAISYLSDPALWHGPSLIIDSRGIGMPSCGATLARGAGQMWIKGLTLR